MRKGWIVVGALVVLFVPVALVAPASASAQAGITQFMTGPTPQPRGVSSIGGYVSIEEEFDLFGIYRAGLSSGLDIGARLGYTDAGDGGVHLGGDLRYALHGGTENFPLALALVGGVQISLMDRVNLFAIPFGVSLGREVGTEEMPVMLYGSPRLRIETVDPDTGDSDTELEITVELGGQVQLSPRLFADGALALASDDDDNVAFAVGLRWLWP